MDGGRENLHIFSFIGPTDKVICRSGMFKERREECLPGTSPHHLQS